MKIINNDLSSCSITRKSTRWSTNQYWYIDLWRVVYTSRSVSTSSINGCNQYSIMSITRRNDSLWNRLCLRKECNANCSFQKRLIDTTCWGGYYTQITEIWCFVPNARTSTSSVYQQILHIQEYEFRIEYRNGVDISCWYCSPWDPDVSCSSCQRFVCNEKQLNLLNAW